MKTSDRNSFVSGSVEFENTLRLIARLSAPEGLEERVQTGLRTAPGRAPGRARILAWPVALRLENAWVQNLARSAAAAAIVGVVAGGGWSVYSRVQLNQPARVIAVPPRGSASGGFSSAGAMRTPQTLNGPVVAHPATAAPQAGKSVALPAQAKHHHGKPAAAKNPLAQPLR